MYSIDPYHTIITISNIYIYTWSHYFCKNSVCEGECILWQIITVASLLEFLRAYLVWWPACRGKDVQYQCWEMIRTGIIKPFKTATAGTAWMTSWLPWRHPPLSSYELTWSEVPCLKRRVIVVFCLVLFVCLIMRLIDRCRWWWWVWRWRGRHDTSFVHCPASLYRNFFSKLDLNGDGKISFQEFRACLVCTGDGSWKWLWVQINEENARSIRFANHRFSVVWQLQKNLTQQRWVRCGIRVWHALMIFHVEFLRVGLLNPG